VGEHTQHIEWRLIDIDFNQERKKELEDLNFSPAEVENMSETYKRYWAAYKRGDLRFNMQVPSKDYQDFADPICDFVLSEYQRHCDREYSRRDRKPRQWPPIFVCPRCEQLVMPKRVGRRKYCSDCSDLARAQKYRDKASPGEGRDYQWLYRLLGKERGLRNAFLRIEKNQERLKQIKFRQKTSSRCRRLMERMEI
jgi:hypothetical protein